MIYCLTSDRSCSGMEGLKRISAPFLRTASTRTLRAPNGRGGQELSLGSTLVDGASLAAIEPTRMAGAGNTSPLPPVLGELPGCGKAAAVPSAETHGCRAESGHSHRRTSLSSRARTRMARTRRNEADWCSNTFAVGAPGLSRGNPKTAGRINRGLRGCPPCLRLHRPSRSAADRNPGTPRVMGARSPAIEVFRGGKLSSATVDAPTNRRPTLANSGSGDGQRARLSRLNGNELTP